MITGGIAPGSSFGLKFQAGAQRYGPGLWHPGLELYGALALGSEAASTTAGTADFNWWALGLAACPLGWASKTEAWTLLSCVGFEGGLLSAAGRDTAEPVSDTGLWLAPTAGLRAGWFFPIGTPAQGESGRRTRLGIVVQGDVLFPLRRDRFVFRPNFTAYQVPTVAGRGSLAITLDFWL